MTRMHEAIHTQQDSVTGDERRASYTIAEETDL